MTCDCSASVDRGSTSSATRPVSTPITPPTTSGNEGLVFARIAPSGMPTRIDNTTAAPTTPMAAGDFDWRRIVPIRIETAAM